MDKSAMSKIGYGLYVATAREEKDNGCIINTVMQVTSEPNMISVGINKLNYTHDMICHTGEFNLSILTIETPFTIFEHFGYHSGKNVDKFTDFPNVARAQNGIYYITKDTNSCLCLKVQDTIDCGTHSLFLTDVTDALVFNDNISVSYEDYQQNIKPKPEQTKAKGYRCKVCGYIYEGEDLPADYICPICKHGAEYFEKING